MGTHERLGPREVLWKSGQGGQRLSGGWSGPDYPQHSWGRTQLGKGKGTGGLPLPLSSWATRACSDTGTLSCRLRELAQGIAASIPRTGHTSEIPWARRGGVPTAPEEPAHQGPSSNLNLRLLDVYCPVQEEDPHAETLARNWGQLDWGKVLVSAVSSEAQAKAWCMGQDGHCLW